MAAFSYLFIKTCERSLLSITIFVNALLWCLQSLDKGSKGCIQGDGVSSAHAVGLCDWMVLSLTVIKQRKHWRGCETKDLETELMNIQTFQSDFILFWMKGDKLGRVYSKLRYKERKGTKVIAVWNLPKREHQMIFSRTYEKSPVYREKKTLKTTSFMIRERSYFNNWRC